MTNVDFSIQDIVPKHNSNEYVLLQAGKGRAKHTKIYINHVGFSYLEGLIWDKFREFSRDEITKIHSKEFDRILDGFKFATNLLEEDLDDLVLQRILKFNLTRPKYELCNVRDNYNGFKNMLIEITEWLTRAVLQEKFVYIKYQK